jgi:hypothetical protein
MISPTLQNIKDFAAINMIPEKVAELYWMNFECQDWIRANNQKITKWQVHFKWWFQSECWKSMKKPENSKKTKLFPLKGGHLCSKRDCQMPAVYEYYAGGNYSIYRCGEHLPDEVKVQYE